MWLVVLGYIFTRKRILVLLLPPAKFKPSDLKKLFSISAKTLNSLTFQQRPDFCEDWFSVSLKSFIYISYF